MGRPRIVVLLTAVAVWMVALAVPVHASAEGSFVSKINASRAASGLAPLQSHGDLVDDARAWSQRMMEAGAISHNPNLASVTSGWEALGENVGRGPNVDILHQKFMESSGHRGNILGDYTHVGVGVVVDDGGTMWVTVVFMRAHGAGSSTPTTTTTTAAPVTTTTMTTTTALPVTTTVAQEPAALAAATSEPVVRPTASRSVRVVPLGRPPGLLPVPI